MRYHCELCGDEFGDFGDTEAHIKVAHNKMEAPFVYVSTDYIDEPVSNFKFNAIIDAVDW